MEQNRNGRNFFVRVSPRKVFLYSPASITARRGGASNCNLFLSSTQTRSNNKNKTHHNILLYQTIMQELIWQIYKRLPSVLHCLWFVSVLLRILLACVAGVRRRGGKWDKRASEARKGPALILTLSLPLDHSNYSVLCFTRMGCSKVG